jgi:hypothetical protein
MVRLNKASLVLFAGMLLASTSSTAQPPLTVPPGTPGPTEQVEATPPQPKPEMERPTVWGEPTEVHIVMYVIDVDEVDSASQRFSASVYYQATWSIPSLVHQGPGPVVRGLTEVWNPRLAIVNQQQGWNAYPGFVEISPNGHVVYRQKVWGWFSQPLDLRDFPMDRQTLTVHLAAAGMLEKDVKMISFEGAYGRKSGIAKQFSIPDFDVLSWRAGPMAYVAYEGAPGTAGYQIQIEVRRKVAYYVMKIILPLCLIVLMSWAPRWIKPEQIGTNVGISTTAFLTLVAYLFAINVLLPRVSYVTRMDRFILLSMCMVFAGLLQTVANTALVSNEKTAKAVRMDRWSRGLYPAAFVGILAVSFGF